jgi:hypothetical protein
MGLRLASVCRRTGSGGGECVRDRNGSRRSYVGAVTLVGGKGCAQEIIAERFDELSTAEVSSLEVDDSSYEADREATFRNGGSSVSMGCHVSCYALV